MKILHIYTWFNQNKIHSFKITALFKLLWNTEVDVMYIWINNNKIHSFKITAPFKLLFVRKHQLRLTCAVKMQNCGIIFAQCEAMIEEQYNKSLVSRRILKVFNSDIFCFPVKAIKEYENIYSRPYYKCTLVLLKKHYIN
jgi:hypothetical protein